MKNKTMNFIDPLRISAVDDGTSMDGIDRLMAVKVDLGVQGYCDNKKKERENQINNFNH